MPATWKMYGVDANHDGEKDPFNPVDAIFAAARYLQRRRRRPRPAARDLRLQPRRLVRRLGADARPGHRRPADRPRRLAHRPHAGPLPDRRQGHLRRRAVATRATSCGSGNAAMVVESSTARSASSTSSPRPRAGDRRQRRPRGQARREQAPRALRPRPGRLRQHLHLRAPRLGLRDLPGAQAAHGAQGAGPPRAAPARPRGKAPPRRPRSTSRAGAAKPAAEARARRIAAAAPVDGATALKERLFAHPTRPHARVDGGAIQLGESLTTPPAHHARPARPRPEGLRAQEDAEGRAPHRRHDPRPPRQAGRRHQGAPALRDPPRRQRRPAHRPEADPRRLEAARVHRDLPRRRQEPVLRPGRREARRSARSC